MKKVYLAIAALALIAALVVAGCGGGSSSTATEATEAGAAPAGEANAGTSEEKESSEAYGEAPEEGESASEKPAGGESAGGKPAVVKVGNAGDLGQVIVDAEGLTLYDFHADKGTTSACYGACATAWPPLLTTGTPAATSGAQASLIGTTKRKDGTEQVTYKGHPLYLFVGDQKPGDATGNDITQFGAAWYALLPNGEEPEDN
jgi:predicted lipoprotein with Yx(FWY)xxD motif